MMHKLLLTIFLFACCLGKGSAHDKIDAQTELKTTFSYAYIQVEGKFLSKKLTVKVDLGDSDEQIAEGEKLSKILPIKDLMPLS